MSRKSRALLHSLEAPIIIKATETLLGDFRFELQASSQHVCISLQTVFFSIVTICIFRMAFSPRSFIFIFAAPEIDLMERILKRAGNEKEGGRDDDNIHTALTRLRTFHQYHHSTMEWLREHHVPVVNLDCSGPAENVWNQLSAIGRLMRPVTRIPAASSTKPNNGDQSDVA